MGYFSQNYDEKRNFIRMQVGSPVNISTEDGDSYQGKCIDLSGGGMLVEVGEEIDINSQLQVSVMSNHGHSPTLNAECSVTRVEQASKNSFFIGLEIIDVLNKPTEDLETAE